LDFDESAGYFVCDYLNLDFKDLESIIDLEKIIGKYKVTGYQVQGLRYRFKLISSK
jgi:hypothetical protein